MKEKCSNIQTLICKGKNIKLYDYLHGLDKENVIVIHFFIDWTYSLINSLSHHKGKKIFLECPHYC